MKVLLVAVCMFVVTNAKSTVRLLTKNGQEKDFCTPFTPMMCRMRCPEGSEGITDACGRCACIDTYQPTCFKGCMPGERIFPPCHCVKYNSFISKKSKKSFPPPLDSCSIPKSTGPCRAAFRKFFHNSATGQCEQFIYGGCEGNSNRFNTMAECRSRCM